MAVLDMESVELVVKVEVNVDIEAGVKREYRLLSINRAERLGMN